MKATVLSITTELREKTLCGDPRVDIVKLLYEGRTFYTESPSGLVKKGEEVEVTVRHWHGDIPLTLRIVKKG